MLTATERCKDLSGTRCIRKAEKERSSEYADAIKLY